MENRTASFAYLLDRLLVAVLQCLNNGEVTERGLARLIGISQPQMHNVLKGKRRLQPELADRLLQALDLDLFDLLSARPGDLENSSSALSSAAPRKPPVSSMSRKRDSRVVLRHKLTG